MLLVDALMSQYNSYIQARIDEAQSNYKKYINGMINIVQLNPSAGNKLMVYSTVADYFKFLLSALQSYQVLPLPMSCKSKLTKQEADDIIASARNVRLECPAWLKMSVSLQVAKLKADCEGFNIEADVYKLLQVGAEKKFKSGTSTLYVGAGIEGSFKGVASGEIKQQFYIVFDNNNEFADLGMRGSGSGDLAAGGLKAEIGYDFALNAGFNAQGEIKSEWIEKYEKALDFVVKHN